MNQMCKVCGEPAAGFHFGAFTCEGCKSFFGRTYNNLSSISECKNNGECVINKKNRTACKACRLRKCLLVGMSKSGSRYGRRSNWFKIHCLLQEQQQQQKHGHGTAITNSGSNSEPGSGAGGGGRGDGVGGEERRNGALFAHTPGMESNMAKYLEHFGTNAVNAFRIRNNNNNYESTYGFYDQKSLQNGNGKRSSCSKSDEEDSNHSSSIVVDEDSQPNRDESPILDSPPISGENNHHHHHHQHSLHSLSAMNGHHHHHLHYGPLFRPGIEPISPFSQKYQDFFISPFMQSVVTTGLKRPSSATEDFESNEHVGGQDTPIDLSIKSKISRISTDIGGVSGSGISINREQSKSPPELEKKNPLDLSLLPTRCNPILG